MDPGQHWAIAGMTASTVVCGGMSFLASRLAVSLAPACKYHGPQICRLTSNSHLAHPPRYWAVKVCDSFSIAAELLGAISKLLGLMEILMQSSATKNLGDRIVKVNHAGEHGAIGIYSGQILMAKMTAPDLISELIEFRSHEQEHRAIFATELRRRGRPRCRSYWLCGLGGFVLGLITGLLGRSAIAATTVAVESVVLRHLEQQLVALNGIDSAAVTAISAIVAEERQHHDQSAAHVQAGKFWPKVLTPIVSASTEAVIWMGMRL